MSFTARSSARELMDENGLPAERVFEALRELSVINRFLGGHATSRRGIAALRPAPEPGRPLKVLDLGAGGADVLRKVSRFRGDLQVTTLDINAEACHFQESTHEGVEILCGDALTYPFAEESFDIVHLSLFLHHFPDEAIDVLLARYLRIARAGMVINDLHRSRIAFAGIWVLTRLFSRSRYVRKDGPLSVQRAFSRGELERICSRLPVASYRITWHWAFRWLVVLRKREHESV